MIDETLRQFVEFVKGASPLVWSAFIRQVYSEAVSYFAWGIGLAVVAYMLYGVANRIKAEGDDDEPSFICSWIGIVIAGIVALLLTTSAIQHVINPDFYAIRFLISSLGGG